MASRKTFGLNRGFTLVEILIAVAILAIIITLGLFISFDFYRSYAFHAEKSIIVSTLQRARNLSLNNINEARHGIHFDNNAGVQYIIFECGLINPQCDDYSQADTAKNVVIDSAWGIYFTPLPPFDIVFEQLSGACKSAVCLNPEPTITIVETNGSRSYDININTEGRISW